MLRYILVATLFSLMVLTIYRRRTPIINALSTLSTWAGLCLISTTLRPMRRLYIPRHCFSTHQSD
ncbi:hypothetical protein BGZ61DRAFT_463625 [Ilyonectria robusta]|uniref:uncharacterized protein n=1 Tax=Ilyonectria robusta TaxID=1079257 RepID=UPI001E8EF0B1|nr:uncharacterized protein BGZ61DRAFT_463625 [Ilyonectria robusta]KAH8661773.1 hypothetical protein BGZ61DRAFT_463625 [Ilyonectria robusta]